jgi:light-regulated signal transduction histidine kinase (bacteriophytochrome)
MNGYALVLLEDFSAELPAEAQRLLRIIRDSGTRMGELIDDLLALSRLGRKELNVTRVDMRALVQSVVAESTFPGLERAHISIGELPSCAGDPSLLRHVWMNLLSNACKYSIRRAEIEIDIQGSRTPGGQASYTLRDNGAGFDMRYAHKLFGVFQRLHSVEEFEGTGVGLAIVHRIVERHGGRVWASAELDQGATFGFSIPAEGRP